MTNIWKPHGEIDGCRTLRNLYLSLPNARPVLVQVDLLQADVGATKWVAPGRCHGFFFVSSVPGAGLGFSCSLEAAAFPGFAGAAGAGGVAAGLGAGTGEVAGDGPGPRSFESTVVPARGCGKSAFLGSSGTGLPSFSR